MVFDFSLVVESRHKTRSFSERMSTRWLRIVERIQSYKVRDREGIRLTDEGEFVRRGDLTDAIYEIRNCDKPELIVWYIHGWMHNADEKDSDLSNFKTLIQHLAKTDPITVWSASIYGLGCCGWSYFPSCCHSGTESVPLTESANQQFLPKSLPQ